ncbi:MAG: hypothetical protein GY763_02575, partial [Gammaproteobacteria bacterium]|nr:hypothetical protein [Gammaproteobacteria bacterium]
MKKISQFNVMGSFEVKDENGETIEFSHRKVQALLAYLSLERSRPRSRERLATLLWSRTGDERARHNLRQALSRIRKQCPDLIDSRDDTVALKATACTVDVICFSDLVQSDEISDLQQALELYRGDLLADYSVREPEFQDWLQQARGRIRRQTCEVADRLAARLREQGRDREAVDVLNRLLWIDPANESAHRDLMLLFTGMGRRSEALLQYQECAAALSRELDVEPGPETRQLLGEIKNEKLTTSAGENKSTRPLPGNLATILYADVARHSHLVDENEDETHRTLCHYLDLINTHVNECDGRVMYSAGDAVLAQFTDAVDALSCALMVQHELDDLNQSLDESRQVCFRIGVNSGDVIEDHDDVYGEGVDVAIRLEALAQLGGVCVSDTVRQGVSSRISADFQFIGEQQVKNIAEPIRAYYVAEPGTRVNQTEKPAQVNVLTPLVVPGKPSLVVKPFVNLSTEAEQDFFAEGLTREICTALVKIPSLFLAWDESPAAHISRDMSVSELGRRFGVRFVLSGGIRRQGDRVRVNAELVEAQSGQCVWADRFDRELKDLFLVQDEITEEIVTAMDVKLVHGEAARFMRKAVTSPAALEAMYQGWHALYQGTSRQDIREAQHLFEEVIRLEPEAGFAYASASLAYWAEAGFGRVIVDSPLLDRSTELARRA